METCSSNLSIGQADGQTGKVALTKTIQTASHSGTVVHEKNTVGTSSSSLSIGMIADKCRELAPT